MSSANVVGVSERKAAEIDSSAGERDKEGQRGVDFVDQRRARSLDQGMFWVFIEAAPAGDACEERLLTPFLTPPFLKGRRSVKSPK